VEQKNSRAAENKNGEHVTLAFVFPGQGSQSIAMQDELARQFAEVQATYAQASEALGYDLWQLAQVGPKEKLDETVVTQPVMMTAGVAAWRAWQTAGGESPSLLAGHSLGEYTALVCAGVIEFTDAIRLIRRRAELMQQAVPAGEGAMAAILGLDDEAVLAVCRDAAQGQVVQAVNFNTPGQVVIAGARPAVERAAALATEAGARRALLLNVSVPAHSELMQPAAEELAEALAAARLEPPSIPVISNADVLCYETVEQIRDGLKRQLYSPVRWAETILFMIERGTTKIVECGPGKVLAGLNRRIDRSISSACLDSPAALEGALE
jgi:[acyl-carrier-protein] S-malonyltransferase